MKMRWAAGVLATGVLAMLAPKNPPMRMGLWETQVTTTVKVGGVNAPTQTMPAQVVKVRACLTEATYAKQMAVSPQSQGCSLEKEVWTANSYTTEVSCAGSNAGGHVAMRWPDKEHSVGTVHMEMEMQGRQVTTDSTVRSHFLSASCGTVTPEKPEMER